MPTPAFMTLQGERQGLISAGAFTEASVGNVYQLGREDQIMIQALSHGIFVPKGSGAGRRMHKPLVITKAIDKASPLINIALCSGSCSASAASSGIGPRLTERRNISTRWSWKTR